MDYYGDNLNFKLINYPFYSDKNAKEYKDFQIGMVLIYGAQRNKLQKMKQLIIETNTLKEIIKTELQND